MNPSTEYALLSSIYLAGISESCRIGCGIDESLARKGSGLDRLEVVCLNKCVYLYNKTKPEFQDRILEDFVKVYKPGQTFHPPEFCNQR